MSFSTTSSISKTPSIGTIPRKERSFTRNKGGPEDGFQLTYTVNCEAAGLSKFPWVNVLQAERTSWLTQKMLLIEKRAAPRATLRLAQSVLSNAAMGKLSGENRKSFDYNSSKSPGRTMSERYEKYEIVAIYNDAENEGCINMLIYKDFPMENEIMGVLQKTLLRFTTLKVLRCEYCNLTSDQLKAIKFLLQKCENITELSLDGNPIKNQNYHILLRNTKLVSLSLRFCKIDEKGLPKFIDCLYFPSASTLIVLDLSNNFIGDVGCQLLAKALRTNRSLTHLSLANNLISGVGCNYLLDVLQGFVLTHDEILLKRKMNMDYLLNCEMALDKAPSPVIERSELSQNLSRQEHRSSTKYNRKKSPMKSKKEKSPASSLINLKKIKRKSSSYLKSTSTTSTVLKDPHPYMHECTHQKKKVFCHGNFNLEFLNLSYNFIGRDQINNINDTLMYQIHLKPSKAGSVGMVKLFLEGNPLVNYPEFKIISELMYGTAPSSISIASKRSSKRILYSQSR